MSEQRSKLLDEIAANIAALSRDDFLRIAVDGVDGAGKTHFADEVALALRPFALPIIRASVDGFHNPRSARYRKGKHSPEGFYLDSYDYAALRRELLDPLGPSGSGVYRTAVFDHRTDARVRMPQVQAAPRSVLIVDGIFLHRPELCDVWDMSIFLHVPFEISIPRGASRGPDFGSPDPNAESNRRYIEGQRRYLRECTPERLATICIDNGDLNAPFAMVPE
ncbi:MAG: uridine kinase [Beijerinckiaceae bacterium]